VALKADNTGRTRNQPFCGVLVDRRFLDRRIDQSELAAPRLITRSAAAFAILLDELKPANLDYRFTRYRGENHDSVPLFSFPAGLFWVYRPGQGVK
jgi:hypothetical protein